MAEEEATTRTRTTTRIVSASEWKVVELLGSGTYGCVEKVEHVTSGEILARKTHTGDPATTTTTTTTTKQGGEGLDAMLLRELSILKRVHHPNVLHLKALAIVPPQNSIALFTELCDTNLEDYVYDLCHKGAYIGRKQLSVLLRQLLQGVEYLHTNCIIHRDLKPANLFLRQDDNNNNNKNNSNNPLLVIGDLGMARFVPTVGCSQTKTMTTTTTTRQPLTPSVQTPWYRAPEVFLSMAMAAQESSSTSKSYDEAIDMFSVGAIMGEWMAAGRPLFAGETTIDSWNCICCLMGTPTLATWPGLPLAQQTYLATLPQWACTFDQVWQPAVERYGSAAVDLLKRLLCVNPRERITVRQALEHAFFQN